MIVRTYRDLISGLDARRKELGLPMLAVDYASGLADGHTAKILCGGRNLGPVSLGLLLQVLGVELVLRPRSNAEEVQNEQAA